MLLMGIVTNVARDTESMVTERARVIIRKRARVIIRIRFGIEQMMPEIGAY